MTLMNHIKTIMILPILALAAAGCSLGAEQQEGENTVVTLESGGAAADEPTPTPLDPAQSNIDIPESGCAVHVPRQAYVFDAPAFSANRQTTLQGPLDVPGLARTEDYWFEIEYPDGQRGAWVSSSQINFGNDMANDTRCQNLPVVMVEVEECVAANITSEVQTIYKDPALSEYLGRFHPDNTLVVLGQSSGALEVWVGAFATEGWIDASIASVSGNCG